METSEISFCNKIAINLLSEKIKKSILDKFNNQYNISITDKNCYILNSKTLNNIIKNYHLISTKTIGTNYYLYLTKLNDINYCLFIDKKISNGHKYPRIISVKYRFSQDLFNKDTLFDGELVRYNNTKWLFIINDLVVYKNNRLNKNIIEKIEIINDIMMNQYKKDNIIEICPLQIKKYFKPNNLNYLINEFLPKLNYKCNGIYFTPLNIKYSKLLFLIKDNENVKDNNLKGSEPKVINNSITKRKKIIINDDQDNNIIFKIVKTVQPDIYELHIEDNNSIVKHSIAYLPTLKCSKNINNIFKENKEQDKYVICTYNIPFDKWTPISEISSSTPDNIEKLIHISNKLKLS